MRKTGLLILLSYFSTKLHAVQVDSATSTSTTSSPVGSLIIGAVIVIAVVFVLFRKQKRKFND